MALSTPVKALALVVFLAAIGGATYAVQATLGNTVEAQLVSVSASRSSVNATGGHDVTYLVTVSNRDTAARDVILEAVGAATGRSGITTVRGGANATVFLTVSVPEDIQPGDHAIDVRILSDERIFRERSGLLNLRVFEPAPGFAAGDAASATFTGRLSATGRVFQTNDRGLVGLNVPKTDTYRFAESLLIISTEPRLSVVTGLYEGVLGMQPGETRTVSFPPEKGYGPATEEEIYDRVTPVPRLLSLDNVVQNVPRAAFDAYVAETKQGNASDFEVGSIFRLDQNQNLWPYRIVAISDTTVEYQLAAEVGDAFTIYPFWPNASTIAEINESTVVFSNTPTKDIGEPFTYRAIWPQMSAVSEINETAILIRHSPPVGFSYTNVVAGQQRQATVKEVSDERVLIALPSPNPLAGKDLTFDVTLLELQRGPS